MSNLPDTPLSGYQAANLLAALPLVPDTGDWHGELRLKCEAILRDMDRPPAPNKTTDEMRALVGEQAS